MTNQLTLRALDIPSIHKFAVGFDNVLDELMRINAQQSNGTNYPPYNVLKHDEDHFSIELAVAGFKDGDITITVEKNILTIKGERPYINEDAAESTTYLHQGIGYRNFARTFTLAEHVEVVGAKSENGILTIDLERKVPEEQRPKMIAINYSK
jgi:molecular chaperone IbpA